MNHSDYANNLFKQAPPTAFGNARQLRQASTDAEDELWTKLRGRRLGGFKFRRQHPIQNFIADFYCHEAALVIEVDGSVHDQQEQAEYDASRTYVLAEYGVTVVRFTNDEVETNMKGVLETILMHLTPRPPLHMERG